MYAGFDYGTSNCAIGVLNAAESEQTVQLLPIGRAGAYIPSTLYALERELISEFVAHNISDTKVQEGYLRLRKNALAQARSVRREHDILDTEQSLFFGQDAYDQYLTMPEEGYFVKSPKSFLGASGLRPEFVQFFEDLVTAMMQNVKRRAELSVNKVIDHTVIGRPVNFQGINAEESNRQAIEILTTSARRAGFKSVEFLFEPLAAGLDFETKLHQDKTVLVVDVGGGTSDCAMVKMGPSHRHKVERANDFLAHTGERVGGNDLDIQLAGKIMMPLFGLHSLLKNGQPMPSYLFWDAVSTNDVGAQAKFNSLQTGLSLDRLLLDTTEPQLLRRLIQLRHDKQHYHVVRSAEEGKIALSNSNKVTVPLSYIEEGLSCVVDEGQFVEAIERPLSRVMALMKEAIRQAGCQPDLIYVTGGTAKSPAIRQAITKELGAIDVVDGDHFGSVAAGLTVWAQRLYR